MIELNELLYGRGIKNKFDNIYLKLILIIFILLFSVVLLVGGKFAYTVLYLYVFTILLSFTWCLVSFKGIHFNINIDKNVISVGGSVNIKIVIKNSFHLFYPYVKLNDKFLGVLFESSISPSNGIEYKKIMQFKRYGRYAIGPLKLEIKDGLGIFKFTHTIDIVKEIKVYPKLLDLGIINFNARQVLGNVKSDDLFREDYTSVRDLRDYAYGDIIKKVNWRATAKRGKLTVKNYDYFTENNVCIYLDRLKENYLDEAVDEKTMECCVSLIKYCLTDFLPVRLITSKATFYAKNMDDYGGILEKVIDLWPDDDMPIENVLNDMGKSMESVAIITSTLTSGLINALPGYARQGIGIIVFWIYDGELTKNYENRLNFLKRFGVDFIMIK